MGDSGRLNILTDPWIPLEVQGERRLTSFVELLAGEVSGSDLLHPRDDMKFFGRMLLSALTQALFPVADTAALRQRIGQPLPKGEVLARVAPVKSGFEMFGPGAFLQPGAIAEDGENRTSYLFLDVPSGTNHTLFRPAQAYQGLCSSCAVLAIYGIQAFAAQGGQGKSPGVRGAPPLTTLIWQPSLRESVWANVLSAQTSAAMAYPQDTDRPWAPQRQEKAAEAIGLVEGLFWQPRALAFHPSPTGACGGCGAGQPVWSAYGFKGNSRVKPGDRLFRHPYTPSVEEVAPRGARSWRHARVTANQPAWTGLAEMLSTTRGEAFAATVVHAAPVVEQWFERLGENRVTLLVLAYKARQAKILCRFSESFTLSMQGDAAHVIEQIGGLVTVAEESLRTLRRQLKRAVSSRAKGGFWQADAESAFWQSTEAPFWTALHAAQRAEHGYPAFAEQLRRVVFRLFDEHTAAAALENTKQALVAKARGQLARDIKRVLALEVTDAQPEPE